MSKCILCGSDYDDSRPPGFCSGCVDRAVWAIDHFIVQIKIPEKLGGRLNWKVPERLELSDRAIEVAIQRLGDLYEEGKKNQLVYSPVWLILLAVATSAEVMKLRTRVIDLEAEVEHRRGLLADIGKDLAKLVDGCSRENKR